MDEDRKWLTITDVKIEASVCCRCDLCYHRKNVVFGDGAVPSCLMIIGEGPGADEDIEGKPFVGRAGKLLDNLLAEAGIDRQKTWITNIVRCRPVVKQDGAIRNRAPRSDEIKACEIWMNQELRFIHPAAIVCLGAIPAQTFISKNYRIGEGRGKWHNGRDNIPVLATYHPAYVLRLQSEDRNIVKSQMLDDLISAKKYLQANSINHQAA